MLAACRWGHLDVDAHLVSVRDTEQFPRRAVAAGIDGCTDVGFARGHNAIEGGEPLLLKPCSDSGRSTSAWATAISALAALRRAMPL